MALAMSAGLILSFLVHPIQGFLNNILHIDVKVFLVFLRKCFDVDWGTEFNLHGD